MSVDKLGGAMIGAVLTFVAMAILHIMVMNKVNDRNRKFLGSMVEPYGLIKKMSGENYYKATRVSKEEYIEQEVNERKKELMK